MKLEDSCNMHPMSLTRT